MTYSCTATVNLITASSIEVSSIEQEVAGRARSVCLPRNTLVRITCFRRTI